MKATLNMLIFVLLLGTVFTATLVGVDAATQERIAKNKLRKTHGGVLSALGIPHTEATVDTVFASSVAARVLGGHEFFFTPAGEVAFAITGNGAWGGIEAIVALAPDHQTLKGLTIVKHEETPGLGSRIADPPYTSRFVGKHFRAGLVSTREGQALKDNEVDGITGATLSCVALNKMLNAELARLAPKLEEAR